MASEWKHGFKPEFSFAVLFALLGLAAAAFVIGFLSIRLVPKKRARRSECAIEGALAPNKGKAHSYRTEFKSIIVNRRLHENSTVIMMTSIVFPAVVAGMAAIAFGLVFFKEHYLGIAQLIINGLASTDDAVWGDFIALFIVVTIASASSVVFFVCFCIGENLRVEQLARSFVEDGFAPYFAQNRSLFYVIYLFGYVVWISFKEWREECRCANAE